MEIDFAEHPQLPGCFEFIRNAISYRISNKGWAILRLPDLKILAHGDASNISKAAGTIAHYLSKTAPIGCH